jgi:hypothetical protein
MLKNYKWLKLLVLSLALLGGRSKIIASQLSTIIPVVACAGSVIQSKYEPVRLLRNVGTSLFVGSLYKEDLIGRGSAVSILLGAGLLYSHYDGLINLFSLKDRTLGAIKTSGRAIQGFAGNYPIVSATMAASVVFGGSCYINKMSPINMLKMYGVKDSGLIVSTFFGANQMFQKIGLQSHMKAAQEEARLNFQAVQAEAGRNLQAAQAEAERNAAALQAAQEKIHKLHLQIQKYKDVETLTFYRLKLLARVDDVATLAQEEKSLLERRASLVKQILYLNGQEKILRREHQTIELRIGALELQNRQYEATNAELVQRLHPFLSPQGRAGQEDVQQQADGGVVQASILTAENEQRARDLKDMQESLRQQITRFQQCKQIASEVDVVALEKAGETNPVMRLIDGQSKVLIKKMTQVMGYISGLDSSNIPTQAKAIDNLKKAFQCCICLTMASEGQVSSHRSAVYGCKECSGLYCRSCMVDVLSNQPGCGVCRKSDPSSDWYGLWSLDVSPTVKGLVDRESKYLECLRESVARLCGEANSKECMDDRRAFLMGIRDQLKRKQENLLKASKIPLGDDLQAGEAGPAELPPSELSDKSDNDDDE